MNVEGFKVELSELLRRFATRNCDKNSSPAATSLTTLKIIEAVQEVMKMKFDVNLVCSTKSEATTPSSGIVMTIPDAPNIPKLNVEYNGGFARRNRSLDTLWAENIADSSLDKTITAESSSLALKVDDYLNVDVPDRRVIERKLMSKSSPEVSTLIRSDTFVYENTSKSVENDNVFEEKQFNSFTINGDSTDENTMQDLTNILKQLKILRDSANDVVKKIDNMNLQKDVSATSQPIRRLSSIGCFPGLHRTSTTGRTIQRPKLMRRSMLAALPGTPTSSRLSPDMPKVKDVPVTRKSTSSMPAVTNIEGSKLPMPASYRSLSSSALTLSKKSITRYDSPTNGCQATGAKTQKKSTLRSPSLSSLNLKNRTGSQQTKNRLYAQAQISKEGFGIGKRRAH